MNRGSWGGILTTIVISRLMNCSYYIAGKRLKRLETELEFVTLEDIGQLIYEYRKEKLELAEEAVIGRYFTQPVVRM